MPNTVSINAQVTDQLNALLTYLDDSQKGYKECARVIGIDALKAVLISEANQRIVMISKLQEHLTELTQQFIFDSASITGPIQRLYQNLKAFISKGDKARLLKEIEKGDRTLADSYKAVLRAAISPQLDDMLQNQLQHFKGTIRDLKKLTLS